jgi:hypothetical protein
VDARANTIEPRFALAIGHHHQTVGREQRIFWRLEKGHGGTVAGVQNDPPIWVDWGKRSAQMCIEGALDGDLIGDGLLGVADDVDKENADDLGLGCIQGLEGFCCYAKSLLSTWEFSPHYALRPSAAANQESISKIRYFDADLSDLLPPFPAEHNCSQINFV